MGSPKRIHKKFQSVDGSIELVVYHDVFGRVEQRLLLIVVAFFYTNFAIIPLKRSLIPLCKSRCA